MARDLRAHRRHVGTVADQGDAYAPAAFQQQDQCIKQGVDALGWPEFSEEDEVGGVPRARDRLKFRFADPVMNHADNAARRPDFVAINVGAVSTFERIDVAALHQQAFDRQVELPDCGCVVVVQAPAVWGIDADRATPCQRKAGIGTAFGPVAVHNIGFELR